MKRKNTNKVLILIICSFLCKNSEASIFGEENITLGAILSNTVQQVKILREQLQQAQESMNELRQINEDYRRILETLQSEAKFLTHRGSIGGVDGFFSTISKFLSEIEHLPVESQQKAKRILSGLELQKGTSKFSVDLYKKGRKNEHISSQASPALSNKLTAQNTALILQALGSLQKTQSEILKISLEKEVSKLQEESFVKNTIQNTVSSSAQTKNSESFTKSHQFVRSEKAYFKGRPY